MDKKRPISLYIFYILRIGIYRKFNKYLILDKTAPYYTNFIDRKAFRKYKIIRK